MSNSWRRTVDSIKYFSVFRETENHTVIILVMHQSLDLEVGFFFKIPLIKGDLVAVTPVYIEEIRFTPFVTSVNIL